MPDPVPAWELVRDRNAEAWPTQTRVDRLPVPGGWIYRVEALASAVEGPTVCFVPQPSLLARIVGWWRFR